MNAIIAPNLKGHKILKVLHIVIAIITVAYFGMGVFGIVTLWNLQPNFMGQITMLIALCFTTCGLFYLLSWISSWTLGWFSVGMIQSGVWRNIRDAVAEVIALLVGVSCVTSAITWIIER